MGKDKVGSAVRNESLMEDQEINAIGKGFATRLRLVPAGEHRRL